MVEGLLVDVHGSAKILFWEDDIRKVEAGETYEFKNLRVKKDRFNGNLYVNPAKGIGCISLCESFDCDLFVPDYDPIQLMTSTLERAEIVGVTEVKRKYCCIKCNRYVEERARTTCKNERCKLTQKLNKCKENWHADVHVSSGDVSVDLIFEGDVLLQVLSLSQEAVPVILTKEPIMDALFVF